MWTFQPKPAAILRREDERARAHGRVQRLAIIAFVGVAAASCYPKAGLAPPPLSAHGVTFASTRWPGVTVGSLADGRALFLAHCNGCHHYPDLAAIADERWPDILTDMAKKSHLDAGERDAVLHFVLASRAEQPGAG